MAVLLIAACLVPLLVVRFPPLVDLYGHLGRYAVQTGLAGQPYFSFEWKLIGNLGVDLLVEGLQPLLGLERAVHLIVILNQLLAALGILWLSREIHGRITPFAIFALPLTYATPFVYGFVNFTLSMAIALIAFAAWLRLKRVRGGWWPSAFLAAAGCITFVCHTFGWAFLCLLVGATSLVDNWRGLRNLPSTVRAVTFDCIGLLPPLVFMIAWRSGTSGARTEQWSLELKFQWLIGVFQSGWRASDILSMAVIVGALGIGSLGRRAARDAGLSFGALLCVFAFIALPARVFGSFFADMRLLPYAMIAALLAISVEHWGKAAVRAAFACAIAFLVFRLALIAEDFRIKDRQVAQVLPALDRIPRGSQVATLVIEPCSGSYRLPILRHIGGLVIARRDAFANDQWIAPGVNLLRIDYDAPGVFRADPSQSVAPDDCVTHGRRNLTWSLQNVPRHAFAYIWVLGALPAPLPDVEGYDLVTQGPQNALYMRRPGVADRPR
ncbi:hypothetical protein ACWPMX_03870 [Tsuneonella sp. HG094]